MVEIRRCRICPLCAGTSRLRICPLCGGTGHLADARPGALRKRREQCGVSLREVARRLSLSPSYLHDVELGRRRATEAILHAYERLERRR
jgi:predicted transcriptional regulator